MAKNDEQRIQQACIKWFQYSYPVRRHCLHSNNNNAKNKTQGAIWKSMGMLAGVADLEYNRLGKTYFIEIKTAMGRQTKNQKEFEQRIAEEGFEYFVIRSLDEFIELIDNIG